MKQIKSYILTIFGIIACQAIVASNNQEQELLSNLIGQELCSLDDAYYKAINDIGKEGYPCPTPEMAEQIKTTLLAIQYNVQEICKQLLIASTHPEAQKYVQELKQRLAHKTPNINNELQENNNFSGNEFMILDFMLDNACQCAVKGKNLEEFFIVLSIRCSTLYNAVQLLCKSSHEQAQEISEELWNRYEQCVEIQHELIKQLNELNQKAIA